MPHESFETTWPRHCDGQGRAVAARALKNKRVHGTRYATRAETEADLFEYIAIFYNRRRRHSTLGYSSPTQFLTDWLSKQADQQPKAA